MVEGAQTIDKKEVDDWIQFSTESETHIQGIPWSELKELLDDPSFEQERFRVSEHQINNILGLINSRGGLESSLPRKCREKL